MYKFSFQHCFAVFGGQFPTLKKDRIVDKNITFSVKSTIQWLDFIVTKVSTKVFPNTNHKHEIDKTKAEAKNSSIVFFLYVRVCVCMSLLFLSIPWIHISKEEGNQSKKSVGGLNHVLSNEILLNFDYECLCARFLFSAADKPFLATTSIFIYQFFLGDIGRSHIIYSFFWSISKLIFFPWIWNRSWETCQIPWF